MTSDLSMASQALIKQGHVSKYMHTEGDSKIGIFKTWNGMDRNEIE